MVYKLDFMKRLQSKHFIQTLQMKDFYLTPDIIDISVATDILQLLLTMILSYCPMFVVISLPCGLACPFRELAYDKAKKLQCSVPRNGTCRTLSRLLGLYFRSGICTTELLCILWPSDGRPWVCNIKAESSNNDHPEVKRQYNI